MLGDRPPPQWMVRLSSTRLSPAKLGNGASTQGSGKPVSLQGTQMPLVPSRGQSSSGAKQENATGRCGVGGLGKLESGYKSPRPTSPMLL